MLKFGFISVLLISLRPQVAHSFTENGGLKILKFDEGAASYVKFNPNITFPRQEFTVCGWVKKLKTRSSVATPTWFDLTTPSQDKEILASADGLYYKFGRYADLRGRIRVPVGQWRHHCFSWSLWRREFRVHFGGNPVMKSKEFVGSVGLHGKIALGENVRNNGTVEDPKTRFAGELYQVNIFDKQLDDTTIRKMNGSGICGDLEESGVSSYISWEEMLLQERVGNVTERRSGCEEEEDEEDEDGFSKWDILLTKPYYNKVLTKELIEKLQEPWNMLDYFVGRRITDDLIQFFKKYQDD